MKPTGPACASSHTEMVGGSVCVGDVVPGRLLGKTLRREISLALQGFLNQWWELCTQGRRGQDEARFREKRPHIGYLLEVRSRWWDPSGRS